MSSRSAASLLLAVLLSLGAARAASAQDYRNDAGWNAGAVWFGSMNSGATGGVKSVAPSAGWVVGVQGQHWYGSGRVGGRLNAAFTHRPIDLPDRHPGLSITMVDADVLLRLLPASASNTVAPFIGLGGGIVYYGFGPGEQLPFPELGAVYKGEDHVQPAAVGSLGFDILTGMHWGGNPVGIRIEGTDHVAKSPFAKLEGTGDFSPVHNVRVVIGVFSGFGALR